MRVLLTGSAGFIGSHIGPELVRRGHDVVGLDLLLEAAHGPVSAAAVPTGLHRVDVRDAGAVGPLLADVDVVCHQAAMVGNGVDASDLPDYASHNDYGTAVLLAAMARRGCAAMVLASSMVVYGEGAYRCPEHGLLDPAPRRIDDLDAGTFDPRCPHCAELLGWATVDEDALIRPRSSYAASKVAQEHYARSWAIQTAGRVIALRYHNVYGPQMPRDTPYAGVAAIFRSSLERGESPRVFEDGGQTRDFVHVADIARANATAVEAIGSAIEPATLRAYNVCSGTPTTVGQMAELLAAARGGPEPEVTGDYRAADVRHIVASPSRAEAELGFRADIAPATGITEFADAPLRGVGPG